MDRFELKYNLLYGCLALFVFFFYLKMNMNLKVNNKVGEFFAFLFLLAYVILFGTRSEDIGTDTFMYLWQYDNSGSRSIGVDFLYDSLLIFLNWLKVDPQVFLFIMSSLYLFTLLKAIFIFSKNNSSNALLITFSFVSLFFFQSNGINIIRQGVSLSFFLLGVAYTYNENNNKWYKTALCFIVAIGFHFTSLLLSLLFLIIYFFKQIKIRIFYLYYIICILLAAINVGVLNFIGVFSFGNQIDERRMDYLSDNIQSSYSVGFKPQFVIFNTLFLLIFVFIQRKYQLGNGYTLLLKYYLTLSGLFFLMFQIPFSDRWGVMSWIIIPFLLSPIFRRQNKTRLAFFTILFMFSIFIFFNNYK